MKNAIVRLLATGLYLGYLPFAPGTFGTLWGAAIAYLLKDDPVYAKALMTAAVFMASVIVSGREAGSTGEKDPSRIVCDEALGFLVAFFLLPMSAFNLILVFILFRFFDILKPYPIGLIERGLKGGLGITADDAMAGVYANIAANAVIWLVK
ncbi:MAG: phosphatidylglycerophosphatase A [Deltaproteobacteria bacterium]